MVRQTQNLRDCAVITVIHLFGASYFLLFVLHFFIFHFPPNPDAILDSVAVLFFCAGVLFWCISSLIYRIISAATPCDTTGWQSLEFIGILVLISTTTIPFVVLQFASQPSIQLSYLSALALVTVGLLVDLSAVDVSERVIKEKFPFHCASLGLLMMVPAIHAFSDRSYMHSPLFLHFGKVAIYNTLFAFHFLLRPLERIGVITNWRPSLYAMHLVLVYSAVAYSKVVLHAVVGLKS